MPGFKVLLVSCSSDHWDIGWRAPGWHMENGYVYVVHSPKRLQIATGCSQHPVPILTVFSSRPSWHGHGSGWFQEPSSAWLHATLAASPLLLLLLLHTGSLQHLFESCQPLFPLPCLYWIIFTIPLALAGSHVTDSLDSPTGVVTPSRGK